MPGAEIHPDCLAAYDAATELLTELGHEVEELDMPFNADLVPHFETLWAAMATLTPVAPHREQRLAGRHGHPVGLALRDPKEARIESLGVAQESAEPHRSSTLELGGAAIERLGLKAAPRKFSDAVYPRFQIGSERFHVRRPRKTTRYADDGHVADARPVQY